MHRRTVTVMAAGALLIGAVIALSSCAANPVSGKQDFMLISEQEEIDMGRKVDASVTREYGLYDDPRLTAYVNDMGRRLGKLSHRPQLDYSVKILDAPVVNAFAVPGGYVYLTRGILASLNSEAELAGVLGHEIGHITARHSAQQLSRAQVAQIGTDHPPGARRAPSCRAWHSMRDGALLHEIQPRQRAGGRLPECGIRDARRAMTPRRWRAFSKRSSG